ncbi:hypothetical protein BKI52_04865 [marine bacterium AO1-C]|nr:hypothetical protein BKI52_04865 [marine bacterium AO1-C]
MQSVHKKSFKRQLLSLFIPLYRIYWVFKWKTYAKRNKKVNLIIGGRSTNYPGWFTTDYYTLDVTKHQHYTKYFSSRKIDKILAEHVLEHLTIDQIEAMLENVKQFASENINVRIAVPDGYHADQNYIEQVKPNGTGVGSEDHKNLFTYQSLSEVFEKSGFKTYLVEYWDEKGVFHQGYTNDDKGYVKRSLINDPRNNDKKPHYTSLIIDFSLA